MGNQCQTISYNDKKYELKLSNSDSPREDFQDIKEFKKEIQEMEIFERPNIAKEMYNNIANKKKDNLTDKEIKERYIEIYKLLLLNDTDKDIVHLYLDFINKYSSFIEKNKRKTFEEEKNKYKILFFENEWGYKTKSEKTYFIEYLKELSESKDYNKLYQEAKSALEKVYHFNYPIEFYNLELFYYKLYILLIGEIVMAYENTSKKYFKNYIENRKKYANMVIKKNLLNLENIINNEDKMNNLIIFILYDKLNDDDESINLNRLLYSDMINKKELAEYFRLEKLPIEIVGKVKGKFIINDTKDYCNNGYIDLDNPICLKNIKNNVRNKCFFFKPLEDLLIENDISLFKENIKLLLIQFIGSDVYIEAINKLFCSYSYCLLAKHTKKDLINYIKKRIKFYPYQDLSNSGLTDKFSLYTYIPVIFPYSILEEEINSVFRVSATFENSIHEINHVNQDILYFKSNNQSMIKTPERQGFKTGKEGGSNLEELLFGRKILNLTLLEALYILNEENFKQNLNDYNNNFKKMRSFNVLLEEKRKYFNFKNGGIFTQLYIQVEKYLYKANEDQITYSMDTKSKNTTIFNVEFPINRGKCCMGYS